jgi:excisionase family DNA binding protein
VKVTVTLDLSGARVLGVVELDEDALAAIATALDREHDPGTAASPYLTVAEAAALLRCTRQRVYDVLSSGRLTRYRDGARVLLSRDEVEAHLRR